jgi:exopolysaccharide biosynthesis WecB/TagA/CpsF family protein
MEQRHPGVVAGFHNGFFKENSPEETAIVRQINRSGADVLVLCMGMPRQEFWAERHRNHLACSSILMAGASMAFLTGFRRRGPRWATDRGLEWFFRLAYEPLTMAPRYLFGLPRLLLQMLRWKLGNRDRGRETGN